MGEKRGQITIFIILGILIVALGVLVFLFFPQIQDRLGFAPETPQEFVQTCLEDKIREGIETVSSQGGSINPESSILYQGNSIEYLCYTSEFYQPCMVQRPLLKSHIENEIEEYIEDDVNTCFNDLQESYEGRGYSVNLERGDMNVELLPKRVVTRINNELVLSRDGTERYEQFNVVMNNNLYELISISNSILQWETKYGDAETTTYMNYYPDLKVEKKIQTDGTTIYIITDRNTGNKFQFASRSFPWPPGYGASSITR